MGVATHNIIGRLAASVGALGAVAPQFEAVLDVPHGGVLCALPALLAVGLLDGITDYFPLQSGYYGPDSLLLLLAFMTLSRINSMKAYATRAWRMGQNRVLIAYRGQNAAAEGARDESRRQSQTMEAALAQRRLAAAPEQPMRSILTAASGSITAADALPKHYVARENYVFVPLQTTGQCHGWSTHGDQPGG